METFLIQELTQLLDFESSSRYFGFLSMFLIQHVLPKVSLLELDIWKRTQLNDFTIEFSEFISQEDEFQQSLLKRLMNDFYQQHSILECQDVSTLKSSVVYSFILPKKQSILSVFLKMESDILTVGTVCSCKLILQKREWDPTSPCVLYYSIYLDKTWFMTGKSRHVFEFQQDSIEFNIDLIPLRAGDFHLPFIDVQFHHLVLPLTLLRENGAQQVCILGNHSSKLFIKDE